MGIAQLACSVPRLPNYLLDLLVVDSHRVGFFAGSHHLTSILAVMWMERHDLSLLSHLRSSTIGLADRRSPFNGTAFSSLGTSTVREGFILSPIPTTLLEPWVTAMAPWHATSSAHGHRRPRLASYCQQCLRPEPHSCGVFWVYPVNRPCGHCLEPTVGPSPGLSLSTFRCRPWHPSP